MPRRVAELRISPGAEEELAAHGLELEDAIAVLLESPKFFKDKAPSRLKMIGPTSSSGAIVTIVIEPAADETGIFDVVTGWPASKGEVTSWRRSK